MGLLEQEIKEIRLMIKKYEEKVKCKIRGGDLITRAECLDLSGESENYKACNDCANCEATKEILLN